MIRWLCSAALKASEAHIAHLEVENQWLRSQLIHERQRAEVSVDQRLSERGLGAVTLPPRPVEPPRVPEDLKGLLSQPEFFAPTIETEAR
jgi:hypothetical protein